MAQIVSSYSAQISAIVPSDRLAPAIAALGSITAIQDTNTGAIPKGRTSIELNWTKPTKNQALAENIGVADGGVQVLETTYDPIEAGYVVYEMGSTLGGAKADTTLSVAGDRGSRKITVASATGASVDDWIQIKEGVIEEWFKITAINTLVLTLHRPLITAFTTAATVKGTASTAMKVITTDYTINTTTGIVTTVTGRFTSTNIIVIDYESTLADGNHFEIYMIPGDSPVSNPTYVNVTGHGSVITVNDNYAWANSPVVTDVLADTNNGVTYTYYIFAVDDEAVANVSESSSVMVEILTTIPQNPARITGDAKVVVSWDVVTDTNSNGYNIYRCTGSFVAANAAKVNSTLITSESFNDGEDNVTNRVSAGTLAFPINGSTYTYKVESVDSVSDWTVGTVNESSGVSAVTTATKTA